MAIQSASACIFIGGKINNFYGRYPGIVEEVLIALQYRKPIYLIGSFGGMTRQIIECIERGTPQCIDEDNVYNTQSARDNKDIYNKFAACNGLETIDYNAVLLLFRSSGIEGLCNGLSKQENATLFNTTHITEMLVLILRGMGRLQQEQKIR